MLLQDVAGSGAGSAVRGGWQWPRGEAGDLDRGSAGRGGYVRGGYGGAKASFGVATTSPKVPPSTAPEYNPPN